jgi:lantibiotic biosynthesis protein
VRLRGDCDTSRRGEHAPASFCLMRTPLLPVTTLSRDAANDALRHGSPAALPPSLDEHLDALFANPLVCRAMRVGCRSFDQIMENWHCAANASKQDDARATLVGYMMRMAGRSDCFGLFAGVSLVRVTHEETDLWIDTETQEEIDRPALSSLTRLAEATLTDPDFVEGLDWETAPGAYRVGDQIRFLARADETTSRPASLTALALTPLLDEVFTVAKKGVSGAVLRCRLNGHGIQGRAGSQAIVDLAHSGLLVPRRGTEPALEPSSRRLSAWLDEAQVAGTGVRNRANSELAISAAREPEATDTRPASPHISVPHIGLDEIAPRHFELRRPTAAHLDARIARQFGDVAAAIRWLGMGYADPLVNARRRFIDLFSDDQVPFIEACDPEFGIVPPFGAVRGNERHSVSTARFLADKLTACLRDHSAAINLTSAEVFNRPPPDVARLPRRFSVVGAVHRGADGIWHRRFDGAYGPTGVHLLARHAAADRELGRSIAEWLADDVDEPGTDIIADIAHLPIGSAADVAFTDVFADHEIVLDDRVAHVPVDRRLYLDDLLLSVRHDRFSLRSLRLGLEVRPRVLSAYDSSRDASSPFRFLTFLQDQASTAFVGWDWGTMSSASYLPSVAIDGVTVSPMQWRFASGTECLSAFRRAETPHALPRWVRLCVAGRHDLIDLERLADTSALRRKFESRSEILIKEAFPAPEVASVGASEGRYLSDLIIPFTCFDNATALPSRRQPPSNRVAMRPAAYPPGSDWLYLKLFAAPLAFDDILRWFHSEILQNCDRDISHWHFVRFISEGDPHLRIRLHADKAFMRSEVMPLAMDAINNGQARGHFRRVQIDSYVPEVTRFGGESAHRIMERLFWHDSVSALRLVLQRPLGEASTRQIFAAAHGVHRLLVDLGLDRAARRNITRTAQSDLAKSGAPKIAKARLAGIDQYAEDTFSKRSHEWSNDVAALSRAASSPDATATVAELAAQLAHLHINRLLCDPRPEFELVVFETAEAIRQISNAVRQREALRAP